MGILYLPALRKVCFVSGWCLFWLISNIQSIFSVLGFVPYISETTVLDCHVLRHVKNSSLISTSPSFRWSGGVECVIFMVWQGHDYILYFHQRKPWMVPTSEPLAEWALFSGVGEGSVKLLPTMKALLFSQELLILVHSLPFSSWHIGLWNSLSKHGCKIIIVGPFCWCSLNAFVHCIWDL